MPAQITISAADVDRLLDLGYTHAEVWIATNMGFVEVTTDRNSVGTLAILWSKEAKNFFRVGGRTLRFRVDGGAEKAVEFSTIVEYWTPQQVADRINEVEPDFADARGSYIEFSSFLHGRKASIEITYCDAHELGIEAGTVVRGKDERIPLEAGKFSYPYTDAYGKKSDRYKWRFSKNGDDPTDFSEAVWGTAPSIDDDLMSVGTACFVGLDGKPIRRRILVGMDGSLAEFGDYAVGDDKTYVFESDENGYLAAPLLRGAKVRVAIEGTTTIRTLTVPDTPTFNILQAMSDAPDNFTVQVPPPLLNRRSL